MAALIATLAATSAVRAADAPSGPAELPPGVVARQGGAQVTLQDIDAYAQKIPEKDRAAFFDNPKRIQAVITNLLFQRQLAAEARADKLDAEPQVSLQVQQATDDTLARVQLEHYRATLKVPNLDQLAKEYYTGHKDQFVIPGVIKVKHILVATKDRSIAEASARIGEVEATAREHPEQFDALVEQYSDDPSKADNHGVIDDAASARMVAPFATAAKALHKVGEVSPIVKTEYGYHVLKLVERHPDKPQTFEEVRKALTEKLSNDYISKQVADHSDQLRNNHLEANPELVASLRTRFLPPGAELPEDAAAAREEAAHKKTTDGKGGAKL
jgi:peptidyl-prolyl cis-trans isomerase C